MTILVALLFIISCSKYLPTDANNIGFSLDLIHRDSPNSPLYNPNLSHYEHMELAFQRSVKRSTGRGVLGIVPDGGEYLMELSHGTPPIPSLSLVDTGSDLSWIQCKPCIHCFPSETPPFNPNISRTFKHVPCRPSGSQQFNNNAKINSFFQPIKKPCTYVREYMDNSHSRGDLVRDTLTLGTNISKVSFPDFLFGCGYDNTGHFPYKGAGLVGFGPQKDSFISQIQRLHGGKFSFCMAPPRSQLGSLRFGVDAEVSGPGFVSTPLILDENEYDVMWQGLRVETTGLKYFPNQSLHFTSNDSNAVRMVIDSGSSLTYITPAVHSRLEALLRHRIGLRPVQAQQPFTLCYPSSLRFRDVPKITFEFQSANVVLTMMNTFVQASASSKCLAILATRDKPILGNVAQTNFIVGYNLGTKMVSFKKTDCSRH